MKLGYEKPLSFEHFVQKLHQTHGEQGRDEGVGEVGDEVPAAFVADVREFLVLHGEEDVQAVHQQHRGELLEAVQQPDRQTALGHLEVALYWSQATTDGHYEGDQSKDHLDYESHVSQQLAFRLVFEEDVFRVGNAHPKR